jgi:hypothetical protein
VESAWLFQTGQTGLGEQSLGVVISGQRQPEQNPHGAVGGNKKHGGPFGLLGPSTRARPSAAGSEMAPKRGIVPSHGHDASSASGSPLLAAVLRSARIAPGFVRRIYDGWTHIYIAMCPSAVQTKETKRPGSPLDWVSASPPPRPAPRHHTTAHCTLTAPHRTDFLCLPGTGRTVASRLYRWTFTYLTAYLPRYPPSLLSGQERASGKSCVPEPPG